MLLLLLLLLSGVQMACRKHLHSSRCVKLTGYNEYRGLVGSRRFAEGQLRLDQQQHSHSQTSAAGCARPEDHFRLIRLYI